MAWARRSSSCARSRGPMRSTCVYGSPCTPPMRSCATRATSSHAVLAASLCPLGRRLDGGVVGPDYVSALVFGASEGLRRECSAPRTFTPPPGAGLSDRDGRLFHLRGVLAGPRG